MIWVVSTAILSLLSITLHFLDDELKWQWIIFWIYMSSVFLLPLTYLMSAYPKIERLIQRLPKKEILVFTIILTSAACVRFALLELYPFISVGDELRDSGLDAINIFDGSRDNLFEHGHYNGYGLIIPTIASFFYRLFPASSLTYRFPAALVSVVDISLIYLVMRKRYNMPTAVASAVVLIGLPLHIFWGRSELIVALDSLITTLVIMIVDWYLQRFDKKIFTRSLIAGILFGFFAGFHVSSRIVVLEGAAFIFFVLLVYAIARRLKLVKQTELTVKRIVGIVTAGLVGFFVGYGPRILETTTAIFFKSDALQQGMEKSLHDIAFHYYKTLQTIAFINIGGGHYLHLAPMVTVPVFALLVVGLITVIKDRIRIGYVVMFFAFLIPLSHSAITESPFAEHRLASLLPPLAILAGIGAGKIYTVLKKWKFFLAEIFLCVVIVHVAYTGILFFVNRDAQSGRKREQFVGMHAMMAIRDQKSLAHASALCLFASYDTFDELDYLHNKEMFAFYLYPRKVTVEMNRHLVGNSVHVSKSCDEDIDIVMTKIIDCSKELPFTCPENFDGIITTTFDRNLFEQ